MGRQAPSLPAAVVVLALLGGGCLNHYVIHPKTVPPEVYAWEEEFEEGELLVRLQWARPEREGPLPAILVHPEANHTAKEMRGVVRSLARAGYLAVAADYRVWIRGRHRNRLFTWQNERAPWVVLDRVRAHAEVDPERIGALGFSQGGIYGLLIAAYTQQLRAVVAYYPLSDFETWLFETERGALRRFVFRRIAGHIRRQLGAESEAELLEMLARGSPLRQAEKISAPVLLIHGDRDSSAPIGQSRRLAERLSELGTENRLLEIEGVGHVFNFKPHRWEEAQLAWREALAWFEQHLAPE